MKTYFILALLLFVSLSSMAQFQNNDAYNFIRIVEDHHINMEEGISLTLPRIINANVSLEAMTAMLNDPQMYRQLELTGRASFWKLEEEQKKSNETVVQRTLKGGRQTGNKDGVSYVTFNISPHYSLTSISFGFDLIAKQNSEINMISNWRRDDNGFYNAVFKVVDTHLAVSYREDTLTIFEKNQ